MGRIACSLSTPLVFFLALTNLSAGEAVTPAPSGEEAGLRKKVLELNKITGTEAMAHTLKDLLDNKEGAKQLIKAAVPLAKEEKAALAYNAAYILALTSAELQDLAASEAFYRVCMDMAVKLQSPRRLLESYGGLIELFNENKKYADSERICRELLELKTDDGTPRMVLTAVTTRFGDTDFIEEDSFDTGKRLRPGIHRLLIQSITRQGKCDDALKLIDNLLKAQDSWMERQLKGWVQREAGRYEEAAKTYEDVLERIAKDKDLETEERDTYLERYRYALSNIYIELKQVDKATEQLQDLLAKKPDDPGYNNDLGYIWADNDMKLEEAEKLIRKALELDDERRQAASDLPPEENVENGAYLDSLGWVLFKQKKYKEAKAALQKAVEDKSSQHIEIYEHLGDACMALGEREAALSAWHKAVEVASDSRRDQERKLAVEKKIGQSK